jgi:hypothetical protein
MYPHRLRKLLDRIEAIAYTAGINYGDYGESDPAKLAAIKLEILTAFDEMRVTIKHLEKAFAPYARYKRRRRKTTAANADAKSAKS